MQAQTSSAQTTLANIPKISFNPDVNCRQYDCFKINGSKISLRKCADSLWCVLLSDIPLVNEGKHNFQTKLIVHKNNNVGIGFLTHDLVKNANPARKQGAIGWGYQCFYVDGYSYKNLIELKQNDTLSLILDFDKMQVIFYINNQLVFETQLPSAFAKRKLFPFINLLCTESNQIDAANAIEKLNKHENFKQELKDYIPKFLRCRNCGQNLKFSMEGCH